MTRDQTPNALRAIGGAPFAVLITAMVLREALDRFRLASAAVLLVAYSFTAYFLWAYFIKYPRIPGDWFNVAVLESAQATLPNGNWPRFLAQNHEILPSALHYYLMTMGHQSCRESEQRLRESHLPME